MKSGAKLTNKCPITLDSFQKNAKKVNFFMKFAIFNQNQREKRHFLRRVRDWKGYGIVQQCGTCEPLQSPTDVALEMKGSAELCRERPNNESRNKNYDARHRK